MNGKRNNNSKKKIKKHKVNYNDVFCNNNYYITYYTLFCRSFFYNIRGSSIYCCNWYCMCPSMWFMYNSIFSYGLIKDYNKITVILLCEKSVQTKGALWEGAGFCGVNLPSSLRDRQPEYLSLFCWQKNVFMIYL